MAARPLVALLIGLLAAMLLGGPASAGHIHHGDGVQAAHSEHERPADKGCCASDGAHCASPAGIVDSTTVRSPADERIASASASDADGPAARSPDLPPKPPRA